MSKRSKWKLPYLKLNFFSKNFRSYNMYKTFFRNAIITGFFINRKFSIYSGKNWVSVIITKAMLGYKLGDFSITKVLGSAIYASMRRKVMNKILSKKKK